MAAGGTAWKGCVTKGGRHGGPPHRFIFMLLPKMFSYPPLIPRCVHTGNKSICRGGPICPPSWWSRMQVRPYKTGAILLLWTQLGITLALSHKGRGNNEEETFGNRYKISNQLFENARSCAALDLIVFSAASFTITLIITPLCRPVTFLYRVALIEVEIASILWGRMCV